MKQLNKKQQNLYRRLSLLSELLLQTLEDLESAQKDKRFKISKEFEKYREELEVVKGMSEKILDIIFMDKQLRSNTYFQDLVSKIDTVIRKTELY